MRQSAISSLVLVVSSLAFGCEAPAVDEPSTDNLAQQEQSLTLAECATQRDKCYQRSPLFGLFTCPAQYNQCVLTASNGLPAQVAAAIEDVDDCTDEALACVAEASDPLEVAVCAENEAQCVAAIVDVDLPDVVEGTAACVDGGVSCIREAESVSDLTACGEELAACAVEQVEAIVPEEVGQVIRDVSECNEALDACILAAETAAELAGCSEDSAVCIAGTLDVTLPDVPVEEVVGCTEDAANCALDASRLSDVVECAEQLNACAADVVENVEVPQQLTCEQKWTACMTRNPFNFLGCAAEAASCED